MLLSENISVSGNFQYKKNLSNVIKSRRGFFTNFFTEILHMPETSARTIINCIFYHVWSCPWEFRLTAANITVTSSSLPPTTLEKPLARAFLAKGDKKLSSCDNFLAIKAMEFAQAWKKIEGSSPIPIITFHQKSS